MDLLYFFSLGSNFHYDRDDSLDREWHSILGVVPPTIAVIGPRVSATAAINLAAIVAGQFIRLH